MNPMSAEFLRQMICDETADICATLGGLKAIILTGSMARDEASVATDHEMSSVLGDAEFLLVFAKAIRVPSVHDVENLAKIVESRLIRSNVKCRVCLSPVSTTFLEEMPPHIFGYELRHCGRVVWGDRNILTRVPAFEAAQIPFDDAVRLLCNRMVELLEIVALSGRRSKAAKYATLKLYLDMATSFLVFAGTYRPTYGERLAELVKLAATVPPASVPFPLPDFAKLVEYCTRLKLAGASSGGSMPDGEKSEKLLIGAVQFAHRLWRWELQRLLQVDSTASDEELLVRWSGSQSWTTRLRGWVRVVRDVDGPKAQGSWKHWLKLAPRTSPRYAIYAAGCQLFFHLPDLLQSPQCKLLRGLSELLPIPPEGNTRLEWPTLAVSIAQNYHRFVEFTRT